MHSTSLKPSFEVSMQPAPLWMFTVIRYLQMRALIAAFSTLQSQAFHLNLRRSYDQGNVLQEDTIYKPAASVLQGWV